MIFFSLAHLIASVAGTPFKASVLAPDIKGLSVSTGDQRIIGRTASTDMSHAVDHLTTPSVLWPGRTNSEALGNFKAHTQEHPHC